MIFDNDADVPRLAFELGYKSINTSIDEANIAFLSLFGKAGFVFTSKEDELMNFVYKRD